MLHSSDHYMRDLKYSTWKIILIEGEIGNLNNLLILDLVWKISLKVQRSHYLKSIYLSTGAYSSDI